MEGRKIGMNAWMRVKKKDRKGRKGGTEWCGMEVWQEKGSKTKERIMEE